MNTSSTLGNFYFKYYIRNKLEPGDKVVISEIGKRRFDPFLDYVNKDNDHIFTKESVYSQVFTVKRIVNVILVNNTVYSKRPGYIQHIELHEINLGTIHFYNTMFIKPENIITI